MKKSRLLMLMAGLMLVAVMAFAGVTMFAVFRFAGWYADNSALPRYCENPRATLALVSEILTDSDPAKAEKRRPYIIAAKLIFLVPQADGESIQDYLDRLNTEITSRCGQRF